nr:DUF268 domain-containing protein [uncultured Acetatifactor sp.]
MRRVLIWGTGIIADRFLENGLRAEIIGYVETYKTKDWFHGKKVYQYTEIPKVYDAIIVANQYSCEIYRAAKKQQLNMEKMIFLSPGAYVDPEERLEWVSDILGEKNFEIYCGTYGIYDRTFYARDKELYIAQNKRESFAVNENDVWPIVKDKFAKAGTISSYFWQDLWAACLIHANQPKEHYDIGSRLDGFIAHVLSFGIPVNMIDIRPFPVDIQNLKTIVADATDMKQFEDNSIESLSALCSLEHFGLGRYGDPIDPEACFKCFESIQKKIKKGGKLYLSVPIGKERLQFNAHRIFFAKTIVENFYNMKLIEYSCAFNGKLEREAEIDKYDNDIQSRGQRFGLFYFEKI